MEHSEILDFFTLSERLHLQILESIGLELDRLGVRDLNDVRALMLLNIGETEMTVSDLMWRGCYLGSNVSYNLKKLIEAGYLAQERSSHDKRVVMVRNTDKALALCAHLQAMNARHVAALEARGVEEGELTLCRRMLRTFQHVWAQPAEHPMLDERYAPEPARIAGSGHSGIAAVAA